MIVSAPGARIAARVDGPADAPALLLANSLGTTMALWDAVAARFPGHRVIRFDLRGHGASEVPPAPYRMGQLVADAEAVMDAAGAKDAVVVGLSIGGMIAQGLAVKRPDLVRGLVLACTAVKMGTPQMWDDRIARVRAGGMEAVADAVLDRWFAPSFADRAAWRDCLLAIDPEGYAGCCAAIGGADLITPTSGLRLPVLALAGAEDRAAPPDLVRETADLVPGSRFELIRRCGHLPPVEQPDAMADHVSTFLDATGHR
ncbi:3-oxoadipate enol-lactonase [Jannaschia sp. Os4]|uniref:3-oxoadipate enol-lactonase n=1 Tax=Jannaschia sp. Os4 TaxID=2807617 RepID=UPI00193AC40F|nr:3-oxoadipate enol-lactonase [Jannaschia sp. Os4]MBM2575973.1 3-oxoadipate enol-lactonase [Jannaschia sp. Os4]